VADEPKSRARKGTVLVLDAGTRHALAAVRGLGHAGWDVVVAGSEPRAAAVAAASRYVTDYHRLPTPWRAAAPFEHALAGIVRRHGCRAVVACSDVTVARLRGLEIGAPTVPTLDHTLDLVSDKLLLAGVCSDVGVMYPTTWRAGEHDSSLTDLPLIVKPRRTAVPSPERVVSRTGAYVAHTPEEVDAALGELRSIGLEAIVQRRVQRAFKINVSFVGRSGATSFRIAYRVLREFPAHGGLAATIETIDPLSGVGARALQAAERVCNIAGYAGLANVEFYGQDDGELCLIEVNARVWGSIWFPERLGLQPTERAVRDVLGEPAQPPLEYRAGRRFHRPTLELKWLLSRSPDRGRRRELIGSLRPGDVYDVLSLSDPMPVAQEIGQVVARGWRSLSRRRRR